MCYGTASVEFPNTYVYIVDVHEEDNTAEIKNVQFFDINGYVHSSTTHDEDNTTATDPQDTTETKDGDKTTDSQNTTAANDDTKTTVSETKSNTKPATNDSADKSYDNTNNANGSIATGQNNVAGIIALVLIIMISAVLLFNRKRKNN